MPKVSPGLAGPGNDLGVRRGLLPDGAPSWHIMGPEADEEPPAVDAWLRMQRGSSGMWAALRIDSREPAALPAGALSLAASVLSLPGHLLLLRLLCRSVFAFVMAPSWPRRRLVGPASGEDLLPVAGEIWVDLQEASSRVASPGLPLAFATLAPPFAEFRAWWRLLCRDPSGFVMVACRSCR